MALLTSFLRMFFLYRHVLNCLVQNEPGVLSRVSGILAGRGFNIDSLVVCRTEIRDLSRMCIVLRGQDAVIEQARRQLEDLVSVRHPPRFVIPRMHWPDGRTCAVHSFRASKMPPSSRSRLL